MKTKSKAKEYLANHKYAGGNGYNATLVSKIMQSYAYQCVQQRELEIVYKLIDKFYWVNSEWFMKFLSTPTRAEIAQVQQI